VIDEATNPDGAASPAAAATTSRWRRLWGSHARTIVAGALGATAGAAYAYFIGCRTGTCPLTSTIESASMYGFVVGAIAGWPARRD
jgi:hypothetical protein